MIRQRILSDRLDSLCQLQRFQLVVFSDIKRIIGGAALPRPDAGADARAHAQALERTAALNHASAINCHAVRHRQRCQACTTIKRAVSDAGHAFAQRHGFQIRAALKRTESDRSARNRHAFQRCIPAKCAGCKRHLSLEYQIAHRRSAKGVASHAAQRRGQDQRRQMRVAPARVIIVIIRQRLLSDRLDSLRQLQCLQLVVLADIKRIGGHAGVAALPRPDGRTNARAHAQALKPGAALNHAAAIVCHAVRHRQRCQACTIIKRAASDAGHAIAQRHGFQIRAARKRVASYRSARNRHAFQRCILVECVGCKRNVSIKHQIVHQRSIECRASHAA